MVFTFYLPAYLVLFPVPAVVVGLCVHGGWVQRKVYSKKRRGSSNVSTFFSLYYPGEALKIIGRFNYAQEHLREYKIRLLLY